MVERVLAVLADAVTDRDQVDWRGAAARLTSSRSRAVAGHLRTLAEIGRAGEDAAGIDSRVPLRLPIVLRAASVIAACIAVAGALGIVSAPLIDGRDVLRLYIVGAFAVTALLLVRGTEHRGAAALGGAYWIIAASFAVRGTEELVRTLPLGRAGAVLDALRPEAFLAAFFWQFAREFPALTHFSRVDRICAGLYRASVALGAVLFAANLVPALFPTSSWASLFQPLDRFRGGGVLFWSLVFGATLPALAMLPLRAREADAAERRRVRTFLYGIAVGLGPVVLVVLAEGTIPRVARMLDSPAVRAWAGWFVYPPIAAMPVITAYVVMIHGVLNVRTVFRRSVKYLLARWLAVWGTAASVLILALYLYSRRSQSVADALALPRAQALVALAAAGVLLAVFRTSITRGLHRWAILDAEEPGAMLVNVSDALRDCRTPLELTAAFASAAGRALQTTSAVYIPAVDDRLRPVAGSVPPAGASLVPLLARAAARPCIVEPGHAGSYYGLLSAEDRSWIDDQHLAVVVPLRAGRRSDNVLAIVALRTRQTGQPFSREDLHYLDAAARAVSFAADSLREPADVARQDDAQELALQCSVCLRVDTWRADAPPCECGGAWTSAALPKIIANRYSLDARLGSGGMGVVYRATDTVLHRTLAVKTLPKLDATEAQRLIVEARAMAALSHPNIAVLYGTEIWKETPVLLMEHLPGGTLAARIGRAPLDCAAALRIAVRLTGALEHVHASGRYHGDIKPSNIGFDAHGSPKFLDFGLSRFWAGAGAPLAGTLPYLSPETLRGAAAGPALDLWALSVVLFEAVAGAHPFLDGPRTELRISAGFDPESGSSCPYPALRTFFEEALAADSARRPQSARAMIERLSAVDVPVA